MICQFQFLLQEQSLNYFQSCFRQAGVHLIIPYPGINISTFECRKLKHFDEEFFKEKLLELDWSSLYDSGNPVEGWDMMIRSIRTILNRYYLLKIYKDVQVKAKWITSELFELMRHRDKLDKKAKLLKTPELWLEGKLFRNSVFDMCKKAKRDFIQSNKLNSQSNPRKFGVEIGKIWDNAQDETRSEIGLIDRADGTLKDGFTVGNIFNELFSKVGTTLQKNIKTLNDDESKQLNDILLSNQGSSEARNQRSFMFQQITSRELERLTNKIKSHKNSGIENISTYLLKISFKILLPQLLHIFNTSMTKGIFPYQWKTAIVTPLYKAGLKTDPQNYRPIVCLP